MNDEVLYNKIQMLDNGVWVINDGSDIYALSIPLFVDYSRRELGSRKLLGGIIIFFFICVIIAFIIAIFSLFGSII